MTWVIQYTAEFNLWWDTLTGQEQNVLRGKINSALSTRAADRLTADDGINFALASQILSVVNPALFLPWDLATHNHFFPKNDPDDGFAAVRYSRFIWRMADAARAIREDAIANHEIDDPAEHLSVTLCLTPPYTLAKFIDEYNFLTITKGETYPGP